jgi:hypothetical protein
LETSIFGGQADPLKQASDVYFWNEVEVAPTLALILWNSKPHIRCNLALTKLVDN